MKKWFVLSFLTCICSTLALGQASASGAPQDLSKLNGRPEPPMLGIHWARGFDPFARINEARTGQAGHKPTPNMTYHGGKIMPTAVTETIFWGPGWVSPGDKISGLDLWYVGFSDSNYSKTSDEYTGTNGQVGAGTSYGGHVVDTTTASGGGSTSAILAEVCKVIAKPDPNGNGYYAVYVDLPRGNASYCAYHSAGSCGGVPVQFAFFWNLDGDAGCDPKSTVPNQSQGLQALANVSGHEVSETRSDPNGNAWYASNGNENGDQCAWTFGGPFVTFLDGTDWKIQGNWSNEANDGTSPNGPGYSTSLGTGCVDGTNKAGPFTK